jgi:hypothetical protein
MGGGRQGIPAIPRGRHSLPSSSESPIKAFAFGLEFSRKMINLDVVTSTRSFLAALCLPLCVASAQIVDARESPPAGIPDSDLDRLLTEIKPQQGESPWREIPWLTDVTEARRRSASEDRPMLVFTAADGSPLGRT